MTRLKYCHIQGKVRYPTYYAAARVLNAMKKKYHQNGGSCYLCHHCNAWHITHFTESYELPLYYGPKRLNKKQKRSERLREKRKLYYDSRPFKGEKLYPMRIIPIAPTANPVEIAGKLSQAFGELKLFVGATTYCALFQMHEALVQLQKCPAYRHDVKKLFKQARTEWDRYERELKNPQEGSLRFFSLRDMDKEYRKRYGDINDESYFEFWTGTGGSMYMKCKNQITALSYKFEKYLASRNVKQAKAYAAAMCADSLLQMAVMVFDVMSDDIRQNVPSTTPTFSQLASPLNPVRIQTAYRRGIEKMFLSSLPELTDEETRNIKLTTDDISSMWSDPVLYVDLQAETIEDYAEDVFQSKGEVKKLLRLNSEKRAYVQQEVLKSKRQEITKKLKNNEEN